MNKFSVGQVVTLSRDNGNMERGSIWKLLKQSELAEFQPGDRIRMKQDCLHLRKGDICDLEYTGGELRAFLPEADRVCNCKHKWEKIEKQVFRAGDRIKMRDDCYPLKKGYEYELKMDEGDLYACTPKGDTVCNCEHKWVKVGEQNKFKIGDKVRILGKSVYGYCGLDGSIVYYNGKGFGFVTRIYGNGSGSDGGNCVVVDDRGLDGSGDYFAPKDLELVSKFKEFKEGDIVRIIKRKEGNKTGAMDCYTTNGDVGKIGTIDWLFSSGRFRVEHLGHYLGMFDSDEVERVSSKYSKDIKLIKNKIEQVKVNLYQEKMTVIDSEQCLAMLGEELELLQSAD